MRVETTSSSAVQSPSVLSSYFADITLKVCKFVPKVFLSVIQISPTQQFYRLFKGRSIPTDERSIPTEGSCILAPLVHQTPPSEETFEEPSDEIFVSIPPLTQRTHSLSKSQSAETTRTHKPSLNCNTETAPVVNCCETFESLGDQQLISILFRGEVDASRLLTSFLSYDRAQILIRSMDTKQVEKLLTIKESRRLAIGFLSIDQVDAYVDAICLNEQGKALFDDLGIPLFLKLLEKLSYPHKITSHLLSNHPEVIEGLLREKDFIASLNDYYLSELLRKDKFDLEKRRAAFGLIAHGRFKDVSLFAAYCQINAERFYRFDQRKVTDRDSCAEMNRFRKAFAQFPKETVVKYVEKEALDQFVFLFLSKEHLAALPWRELKFRRMTHDLDDSSIYRDSTTPSAWIHFWDNSLFLDMAKSQIANMQEESLFALYERAGGLMNDYLPTLLEFRHAQTTSPKAGARPPKA